MRPLYIWSRTISSSLHSMISLRSDLLELLEDYKDESKNGKLMYGKHIDVVDMEYHTVEKLAVQELEQIKPVIEAVLL